MFYIISRLSEELTQYENKKHIKLSLTGDLMLINTLPAHYTIHSDFLASFSLLKTSIY